MMDHGIVVIGGGFTGLAAAYELALRGKRPRLIEADSVLGGLAADDPIGGTRLERFYHHWFTSDTDALDLVRELGLGTRLISRPSNTGMYVGNRFWKLSSPLDLLRFSPLPLLDRIRLGWMTLHVRRITDWSRLEDVTAAEWLRGMSGPRAYAVVWEPLLRAKFGSYAERVSAVWMWNKLVLRGGSRDRRGREELHYLAGGFGALAEAMRTRIEELGGSCRCGMPATGLRIDGERLSGVETPDGILPCSAAIATVAPPLLAELVRPHDPIHADRMAGIPYLANICLTLELERSLSGTYWLNVNDPGFPFVAVIEHTNFAAPDAYGGSRIVYLSRYLDAAEPAWSEPDALIVAEACRHLGRMFPAFSPVWIRSARVHRARWAQPVVLPGHSRRLAALHGGPIGLHAVSMAHVYPEDRGTNYAIRNGRMAARIVLGGM